MTAATSFGTATSLSSQHDQMLRDLLEMVGSVVLPVARQEVPGEVLLANYDAENPCTTRGYAVLAFIEGTVRLVARVFCHFYDKLFNCGKDATRQWEIVLAQWESLKFSFHAIFSPSAAVESILNTENGPRLGTPQLLMTWGTPYQAGTNRTISTWKVWESNLRA